jgi:hypothetical protein
METLISILTYVVIGGLSIILIGGVIEYFMKKISDDNPIKKWWRKHIIDIDPYE